MLSLVEVPLLTIIFHICSSAFGVFLCIYATDKKTSFPKLLIISTLLHLFSSFFSNSVSFLLFFPLLSLLTQSFLLYWSPPPPVQRSKCGLVVRVVGGLGKGLLVVLSVGVVVLSAFVVAVNTDTVKYYEFKFESEDDWWAGLADFMESKEGLNDAYEALGLNERATEKQVNSAFRRQSTTAHPDRGGSAEEYNKIVEARNLILKSLNRR